MTRRSKEVEAAAMLRQTMAQMQAAVEMLPAPRGKQDNELWGIVGELQGACTICGDVEFRLGLRTHNTSGVATA